jgi:hypothetical protein
MVDAVELELKSDLRSSYSWEIISKIPTQTCKGKLFFLLVIFSNMITIHSILQSIVLAKKKTGEYLI